MNRYILDTGVLLLYIREHDLYKTIESDNNLTANENVILVSIVTKAEILSLSKQLNWQDKKQNKLEKIFNESLIIIDINKNDKQLLDAYATIDAYSQGKLPEKPLDLSARNMGKNDLWIAATEYATNSTLITLDNDFDHLDNSFIKVIKYSKTK